jgi:tetratricopeptide (TPR) repeat protein
LDPDDVAISRLAHRDDMRFETYRRLADLEMRLGRPDAAVTTYGILLTRLPNPDGEFWVGIAEAWEAKGEKERALEYFWFAAKQGYQRWGDDWRRYLREAMKLR